MLISTGACSYACASSQIARWAARLKACASSTWTRAPSRRVERVAEKEEDEVNGQ